MMSSDEANGASSASLSITPDIPENGAPAIANIEKPTNGHNDKSSSEVPVPGETTETTPADTQEPSKRETEKVKDTGDKRDHGQMTTGEPKEKTDDQPEKKQKSETKEVASDVNAKNGTEPEKKLVGRPKRQGMVGKTKKTPTPRSSDGIGSRTRSRVKA